MSDAVSEPTSGQAEKSMPDSDNSAAALIKKQISEIEKQILRNAQNQNTRKVRLRFFFTKPRFLLRSGTLL